MIGPFQVKGVSIGSLTSPETLTASFGDNTTVVEKIGREMEQLMLLVTYTPKVGQSDRYINIRIEFGDVSDDLYQIIKIEDITGVYSELLYRPYDIRFPSSTGTVGGTAYKGRISVPVADIWGRISVKESGSDNFGTIIIKTVRTSRS